MGLVRVGEAFLSACLLCGTGTAGAQLRKVPITYRQTSGTRPYVPVHLNGKRFQFMVHAETNFFAMTTHANAAAAHVTDLVGKAAYGITQPGKVSGLGRADAHAATFTVGTHVLHDMSIQVFEIPQTPPVDGMLGLRWLREAKVFLDFEHDALLIPTKEADSQKERTSLLQTGYVAHQMVWDPELQLYLIHPTINGAPATFSVSTVSGDLIDEPFARAHGIALIQQEGTYGGPSGTTGYFYQSQGAYHLQLDGKPFRTSDATVFDTYAYEAKPRPAPSAAVNGDIGCDFMRANKAVIDFGSGTLYLLR